MDAMSVEDPEGLVDVILRKRHAAKLAAKHMHTSAERSPELIIALKRLETLEKFVIKSLDNSAKSPGSTLEDKKRDGPPPIRKGLSNHSVKLKPLPEKNRLMDLMRKSGTMEMKPSSLGSPLSSEACRGKGNPRQQSPVKVEAKATEESPHKDNVAHAKTVDPVADAKKPTPGNFRVNLELVSLDITAHTEMLQGLGKAAKGILFQKIGQRIKTDDAEEKAPVAMARFARLASTLDQSSRSQYSFWRSLQWATQRIMEFSLWASNTSAESECKLNIYRSLVLVSNLSGVVGTIDTFLRENKRCELSTCFHSLRWDAAVLRGRITESWCQLYCKFMKGVWIQTVDKRALVKSELPQNSLSPHMQTCVKGILNPLRDHGREVGKDLLKWLLPTVIGKTFETLLAHILGSQIKVNRQGAWMMMQDVVHVSSWFNKEKGVTKQFDTIPAVRRYRMITLALMQPGSFQRRVESKSKEIHEVKEPDIRWHRQSSALKLLKAADCPMHDPTRIRKAIPDLSEWLKLANSKHGRAWSRSLLAEETRKS